MACFSSQVVISTPFSQPPATQCYHGFEEGLAAYQLHEAQKSHVGHAFSFSTLNMEYSGPE